MNFEQLSSAVYNNIISGLKGETANLPFTLEQIEDELVNERITVIKEFALKGLMPLKDLMVKIPCVDLDCKSLNRCCSTVSDQEKIKHFEIPQAIIDYGIDGIGFVGSLDGVDQYRVYTDMGWRNHKYKVRANNKPYVWIDTTPNNNNKYDGFLFNNKFATKLLVMLVPKDPRTLLGYSCCGISDANIPSMIDSEIEKRLTEKLLRYYRLTAMPITPNDQTVKS